MSSTLSFHKLTRRGQLRKVVREQYLRDDIACGLQNCATCSSVSNDIVDREHFIVPDTNVILHQLDVIEASESVFSNVIILQTVLEEVKHRDIRLYDRFLTLIKSSPKRFFVFANTFHRETHGVANPNESPNDFNDRMIRNATLWLVNHYKRSGHTVELITNDRASLSLATSSQVPSRTLHSYVVSKDGKDSALLDLLAFTELSSEKKSPTTLANDASASKSLYAPHLPRPALEKLLKSRDLFQGVLRVSRDGPTEGRVMVRGALGKTAAGSLAISMSGSNGSSGEDVVPVMILGLPCLNRATEGDLVAIELLPESSWSKHDLVNLNVDMDSGEADLLEPSAGGSKKSTKATSGTMDVDSDASVHTDEELKDSPSEKTSQTELMQRAVSAGQRGEVPLGRVVGVLRRSWRALAGSIDPDYVPLASSLTETAGAPMTSASEGDDEFREVLFQPVDTRFPRVLLRTRQLNDLANERLIVSLDDWPENSEHPRGHYLRKLGPIGDKAAENAVILHEFDIVHAPFSSAVMSCLPSASWTVDEEMRSSNALFSSEMGSQAFGTDTSSLSHSSADNNLLHMRQNAYANSKRVDLRHICVCSIDPPGCKDIDDALHARILPSGEVEVGVHIADVTHFIKEGTALDIEAARRANTTYLVEKRMDMVPKLLTEVLCSLRGGVDRFAFSVTWRFRVKSGLPPGATVDPQQWQQYEWEMVPDSANFFKSIIHSRAAMMYSEAQVFLDDPSAPHPCSEVPSSVRLLASVARSLKEARRREGALTLASAEVKFSLDSETADPISVGAYEMRETNSTVEEFMLLGNVFVARRILEAFPTISCLRRHPAPPRANFAALLAGARLAGADIDVSSSRALAESLDKAAPNDPLLNRLLRVLTTRCMLQAAYFSSGTMPRNEYGHYGLAAPVYTHFTSPIRRYCDVVAHRLLSAALELEPLPQRYWEPNHVKRLADNMNRRHLMSQLAGRASALFHTGLYFRGRGSIERGVVMRVRGASVGLMVLRLGLEHSVDVGTLVDDSSSNNRMGSKKQKEDGLNSKHASRSLSSAKYWFNQSGKTMSPEDLRALTPEFTRTLEFDEEKQRLQDSKDSSLSLSIFQPVKVLLLVEERVRGRQELVVRIIDPPFHSVPPLGDLPIEDNTVADGKAAQGTKELADALTAVRKRSNEQEPTQTTAPAKKRKN